jgi:pimeloyl-ACP methyl ester carboxylesterase
MKLFFRKVEGNNKNPIIILHGLFGSSKNWLTNAKKISDLGSIYLPDARNHGDSPHADTHDLQGMVDDLKEMILAENISQPTIIGHSMGGLVAGLFSIQNPKDVGGLIIIDIAPRSYEVHYEKEFEALNMDVSQYNSRQDIDRDMEKILPDPFIRQFLQMNLEKVEVGYKWKLNVKGIQNSRKTLLFELEGHETFQGKTLFILGEKSDYIREEDLRKIKKHFPEAKIHTIKDADHYLHYKKQDEFLKVVRDFLEH